LGLLSEASRENYLLQSRLFTGWTVQQLTQSTASVMAPDGGSTVQLFTEDTTTNVHRAFLAPNTGQATQTHSVFVKNASGTRRVYLSSDGPSGVRSNISFNLQTATLDSSFGDWVNPFIVAYPNGWYRIGGTITDDGGTTLFVVGLSTSIASYLGDGTSGIYLWGAQLEAGSTPSAYIPTTTTAVTRTADSAVIDGTGVLTGTYTMVEKPAGCAVVSGTNINLQPGFTAERVMVFPAALDAGQITAIRGAM
jgi:hypothetical protein